MTQNTVQPVPRSRSWRLGGIVVTTVATFVLVSCGGGGDTSDATQTTTVTSPQTSTSDPPQTTIVTTAGTISQVSTNPPPKTTETPPPGTQPLGQPSLSQKSMRPNSGDNLLVTGVRIASHDDFDRVVFDFSGDGTPGWFTDYTDTPTQQGSGHPIEFEGVTALYVGIEGTTYPPPEGGPVLVTVPGAGGVVQEVIYSSIFEGRTEYIIGSNSQQPYSVTALEQPTRLVIDIIHPS
ncbi:AMIN-like domain-containing (lipo)protein [Corynebacterium sp. A21]|uniref:AMIN-like domain-containing (lipo)protein n=1 Tax=Corynebacterium sp. A21 TaxID=3457318 RepID=UPI003FD6A888